MKVLMFGWEFPPFYAGGLGIACLGLTKGLSRKNVSVTFVVPHGPKGMHSDFAKLLVANNLITDNVNLTIKGINTLLTPYMTAQQYEHTYKDFMLKEGEGNPNAALYGRNMFQEVFRFAQKASLIALLEDFDVIHCHDWMTYPAGIRAKQLTGKPLVVHIHNTVFDRSGGVGNPEEYKIEKEGFEKADRIIAVSNWTKQMVMHHYGIPEGKIEVVHNGIEFNKEAPADFKIDKNDKVVLFLGRITLQKGPDYFIEAARKIVQIDPNIKFIIVGSGDMEAKMIERVAGYGLSKNILFAGFLTGKDIDQAYRMADVFVMPSVSEPFGLTPLEAMRNNTPVIVSKQSGVSEVLTHALKVDFWDIDEMANKILSVLRYEALHNALKEHGAWEVRNFSWDVPAQKCLQVYEQVIGKVSS